MAAACSASFPEPTVFTVTPDVVRADAETKLTVSADHLEPLVTYDFDRPSQSLVSTTFGMSLVGAQTVTLRAVTYVRAGVVTGIVPAMTPAGRYSLHVQRPQGKELVMVDAIEVRALP
jgi:hypothetical protein